MINSTSPESHRARGPRERDNPRRRMIACGVSIAAAAGFVLALGTMAPGGGTGVALAATQESQPPATTAKVPLTDVKGFRSAHFGMTTVQVEQAIMRDFAIPADTILKQFFALEKTVIFVIDVRDLIPDGGGSQVAYIFGYQSKRLIQINVLWGWPVFPEAAPESVVATANILRRHFADKHFKKDGLLMNAPLSQGTIIVFRGSDANDQMVLVQLTSTEVVPAGDEKSKKKGNKPAARVSLRLSYISNPKKPDIFRLNPDKF